VVLGIKPRAFLILFSALLFSITQSFGFYLTSGNSPSSARVWPNHVFSKVPKGYHTLRLDIQLPLWMIHLQVTFVSHHFVRITILMIWNKLICLPVCFLSSLHPTPHFYGHSIREET
jgi:hypothetical protein